MQSQATKFDALNLHKANFDSIYELPDPREYFRVLAGLDYIIPDLARNVFRSLIEHRGQEQERPVTVLDVGCSFGINEALIRYPIDLQRLAGRYAGPQIYALEPEDLVALDRDYFRSWPEVTDARFVGLDISPAAIAYGTAVGLLDAGITANLERVTPVGPECAVLREIDLIISTGCVGYTSEKTFRNILQTYGGRPVPWVACFVLRMFPYDAIAAELSRFGLVTEKLEGVTFVQRRFHSEHEMAVTLDRLRARGIDSTGKEGEGLFHAELYVSRPEAAARRAPLGEIVSVTRGASRPYGRRYRQFGQDEIKLMP